MIVRGRDESRDRVFFWIGRVFPAAFGGGAFAALCADDDDAADDNDDAADDDDAADADDVDVIVADGLFLTADHFSRVVLPIKALLSLDSSRAFGVKFPSGPPTHYRSEQPVNVLPHELGHERTNERTDE